MPSYPIDPTHKLLLEDNASYLLLEDNASKLILDETVALDDPVNAGTVSTLTPALDFVGSALGTTTYSTPTKAQSQTNSALTTTNGSLVMANTTTGNTIVVAVIQNRNTDGVTSVSDGTNTYTKNTTASGLIGGGAASYVAVFVAQNITGLTTPTITVNKGGASFTSDAIAWEISGVTSTSLDQVNAVAGATALTNTGFITPSQPNSYLLQIGASDASLSTYTQGEGFGNAITLNSSAAGDITLSDKVVTQRAAYRGTMTINSVTDERGIILSFNTASTTSAAPNLTYEIEVDTVNMFDSVAGTTYTPTFVQSKSSGGLTTAPSVTLNATATAGNLLVIALSDNSTNLATFGGYTALTANSTTPSLQMFYKMSDGTEHVITGSIASSNVCMAVAEYSGIGSLDVENCLATASSTTHSTPTVTPVAGEKAVLIFATAAARTGATWSTEQVNGSATGVTEREDVASGVANIMQLSDLFISSTTGSYSGSATEIGGSAAAGGGAIAIFRATPDIPASPLLDKTSDINTGFYDSTAGDTTDSKLTLETTNGAGSLLLEDNVSYLILNQSFPTDDYVTYQVPTATLSNGTTYYWRARRQPAGGAYGEWSEVRSFTVTTVVAPSVAGWAEPVNQFLKSRTPKRQQINRVLPNPPQGSQAPYVSYWIPPVNQFLRSRVPKRQQPPPRRPSNPPQGSQAPYVSYWTQPVNQPLRKRTPTRQQPPKYKPPFPAIASAAPYVSYWIQQVNQFLRTRTPKRQQVNRVLPNPPRGSVAPYISYWIQPVNQFLRKRTPVRQQPPKYKPPFPAIASQAPYVSYWVQQVNQFLKARTPKRQQVNRVLPNPPRGSVAPYISYWIQPVNEPLKGRVPRRQQPPSARYGPFYSIPVVAAVPLVSSWVQPVSQFLKSRVLRRQQVNKANPPYPAASSQAPYVSYWIHPVNEPLKNRVLKRQQPRYNPAVLPPGSLVVPPMESWQRPTNQFLRLPRRRPQPTITLSPNPITPNVPNGWIPRVQQFLRSRRPKRQQPDYTINRGRYNPIPNLPIDFGSFGTIISTTDQLGTLSDIASTNIAGGDIVGIIADSLASASQAGEDASLSIDDSTQNTTLQG